MQPKHLRTTYRYQITAIDKGGNRGPASNPVMVVTPPSVQKVINGEFNQGHGPWATIWNAGGLAMTSSIDTTSKLSGPNSCKLVISQVTGTDWHLQYYQNFNTKAGFTYSLSFKAAADRNTSVVAALQETHSPYGSFIVQTANLTTSPQTFTINGLSPDNDNVNLTFMLGASAPRTLWLDVISVTETSPHPDPQTCSAVYASGYQLAADLSEDCAVDLNDLVLFVQYWLDTDCGTSNGCQGADLGSDGSITMSDLAVFSAEWQECNDPQNILCQPTW
jgi:hypothetical protein